MKSIEELFIEADKEMEDTNYNIKTIKNLVTHLIRYIYVAGYHKGFGEGIEDLINKNKTNTEV